MRVSYGDGFSQDGLVLTLSGARLRVAIQGADDPTEFRLVGDSWLAEDGREVAFAFPLGIARSQEFLAAIHEVTVEGLSEPRTCASGGECLLNLLSADLAGQAPLPS